MYHETIAEKLNAGLSAQRIWQDLVDDFGYGNSYESVKRYVRRIEPQRRAVGVMTSLPGEEALCGIPPALLMRRPGICGVHRRRSDVSGLRRRDGLTESA